MSPSPKATLTPLARIATPKGDVLHALKASEESFIGFGEAYFSEVLPGAIKGWKCHRRMTLNLCVPVGKVAFIVHDNRPGSPEQGQFQRFELGAERHARLTVPPGLWLAFQGMAEETSLVLNIADIPHDPAEADTLPLESLPYPWP